MSVVSIKKQSVDFLKVLAGNNDRDWFNSHKDLYLEAHGNIISFADALLTEMNKHDHIETPSGKKSVYRIYRDVRFSKVKTPYNTHWSGSFRRATKKLRGGYYFRIEPGNSFVAGGFWGPVPDDMKRIREDIDFNSDAWRNLIADRAFVNTFGKVRGEKLLSTPGGYAKDHPAIDLLRYKQFILKYEFTDDEVCGPDFVHKANGIYIKMRPFLDFMSEVLTVDANGLPVV
jgi:uncharacterized protein (TIGR02453 family)